MARQSAYCQFEEKEYETKMNFELVFSHDMIYPPGQVKEHILGFDAGLFSHHPKLWAFFPTLLAAVPFPPYIMGPNGIALSPAYWSALNQSIDHFPAMNFNVFLQYKRPKQIGSASAAEWRLWNTPYFRLPIQADQQTALEKLDAIAGNDALVSYASPCFTTYEDLWKLASTGALTANSNFARPSKVSGHKAYTYTVAGAAGIAHSDPRPIVGESFEERLRNFRERHTETDRFGDDGNENRLFIKRTAKQVEEAATESPLSALFAGLSRRLADEEGGQREGGYPEIGVAFRRILLFCTIANVSWHISG
jgi:hypothetical protein